jgi:hypothetical protein
MLFFCGAIIILLLCLRWCFFTHCRAYNFLFIADPFLSSVCCSSLESEFLHCFEKKNSGLDVAVYVKKKFPIIRSVSVSYQPTVALVNIAVYKPIYMINDSLVLTENNDLVEKTLFAESVLGDLPCVTASQNFLASNAGSLSNLLQKLPVQWAESYDCDCVSEYCIRLTDKFNSRFVIVYSEDQIVSAHMLDQCESVKKDIIKHGMLDKNVSWVADIRFANYIVAYKA